MADLIPPGSPESRPIHSAAMSTPLRRRFAGLCGALVLVVTLAACGSSDSSSAGGGFRLSASQLTPTTTSTVPVPSHLVAAATAKVPEVQVLEQRPGDAKPASATPTASKQLPPIPRVGLNSAGSRKTPDGWAFSNPTYFKNPLVFAVLKTDGDWLEVMVPARPNGSTGWIKASDVDVTLHRYRMELTLSTFHLQVFDGDDVVVETDVVIGKDSTPTPLGTFYLNEKIKQSSPAGAYGPWILSTSGYSEALDTFDGGLPVVGFHGTNQPQLIGTRSSNGCVRMPNDVVTQLADLLPAGTPIEIRA